MFKDNFNIGGALHVGALAHVHSCLSGGALGLRVRGFVTFGDAGASFPAFRASTVVTMRVP
jgi:hypothetical protein